MNVPSTTPHGYTRPLTLRPPESTTVLLPTTANGTRSCKNNNPCQSRVLLTVVIHTELEIKVFIVRNVVAAR